MLLFFLFLVTHVVAERFAVLASGSMEYWNYRHHADVCHAYHRLIQNGISKDNIILLAVGDVPYDDENPMKGTLYNHPGNKQVNVYEDCVIDYNGTAVTPELFVAVLTGNVEDAKKLSNQTAPKVLTSGDQDTVFISFFDHGATGLIAFPYESPGTGEDVLFAKDLYKTLHTMYNKKMYKEALFYMEACESGTMFQLEEPLPPSFLAMTAANDTSSYGTYCPPDDVVDGIEMNTCLGDLFSINWLEDDDAYKTGETIKEQFQVVKAETNESLVCLWGDESLADLPLSTFIGAPKGESRLSKPFKRGDSKTSVPSRDIPQYLAEWREKRAKGHEKKLLMGQQVKKLMDQRNAVRAQSAKLVNLGCNGNEECIERAQEGVKAPFPADCHPTLVRSVAECGVDVAIDVSKALANICKNKAEATETIALRLERFCSKKEIKIIA